MESFLHTAVAYIERLCGWKAGDQEGKSITALKDYNLFLCRYLIMQ